MVQRHGLLDATTCGAVGLVERLDDAWSNDGVTLPSASITRASAIHSQWPVSPRRRLTGTHRPIAEPRLADCHFDAGVPQSRLWQSGQFATTRSGERPGHLHAGRSPCWTAARSARKAFASQVRAGKFTPHVSTWPALGRLVGDTTGPSA